MAALPACCIPLLYMTIVSDRIQPGDAKLFTQHNHITLADHIRKFYVGPFRVVHNRRLSRWIFTNIRSIPNARGWNVVRNGMGTGSVLQ